MELTLDGKRLDAVFLFCLALTIISPCLFPQLRLIFFAPFLVMACYQKSFATCLWLACLCGLIVDLFSAYTRLGIHALDFCLTLFVVYPQRRNFFADSITTLPIMTFLFASLSTLLMGVLLYVVEAKTIFFWTWLITDVFLLSAADAFFAFFCFIIPALLIGKPRRSSGDYFLSK